MDLVDRIEEIERRVARLERMFDRRKGGARIIPWVEVADRLGIRGRNPAAAARKRIERERGRPDGCRIRVVRGGVFDQDFVSYLEAKAAARPGLGEQIRRALEGLRE